ncbi:AraC family transcriptional regulator [Novosphingobium terrae]|uniref:AraC family transcriptional regulator n=1 Tax=Novosphingobium terrae TaxID=2726189 RepID=UPI001980F8C3|nr:AraC family transcriptional regulator [Novosphingobium terrae]
MELIERAPSQADHRAQAPVGLAPQDHFSGLAGQDDPRGQGWVVRLNLRPGFDLNAYHQPVRQGYRVEATTEPCLAITVLLSGQGHSEILGAADDMQASTYRPGTLYVSLARETTRGVAVSEADTLMRLVELRMSPSFLARTGSLPLFDALFDKAGKTHPLHALSTPTLWLGQMPAPGPLLALAEAILRDVRLGGMADLRIEGQALALFDTVVALMRPPAPALLACQRDGAQLDRARLMMRARLDHPWSIAGLAKAVGLNEKRLKQGFRLRFGLPVHATLQADRLDHARQLLGSGMVSVTEASLAVGYANPSHFARLFRRAYGMLPSAMRHG